ncbi:MAG: hypothetical protein EBT13_13855 [Rhodobacteraceae bacterium]|nr:hypothetical protein [Paracoccaceae bacterium]
MARNIVKADQKKFAHGGFLVLSAQGELFNHVDDGLPMWTGQGDRKVTEEIVFLSPFAAAPMVNVALCGIDASHEQNLRMTVQPKSITRKGFVVEFATWGDTRIARASVCWHAMGIERPDPIRAADEFLGK